MKRETKPETKLAKNVMQNRFAAELMVENHELLHRFVEKLQGVNKAPLSPEDIDALTRIANRVRNAVL